MTEYIAAEKNITPQKYDFVFVLLVFLFLGLGLTILYSGSSGYGLRFYDNSFYFLFKQLRAVAMGIVGMIFFTFIPLRVVQKLLPMIFVVTVVLLILPFVPGIGEVRNGSTRWIKIASITFQPSEAAKFTLIIFLANFFSKHHAHYNVPLRSVFPPVVLTLLIIFLVYSGNDFSTSMFLLIIALVLFFAAGVPLRWFIQAVFVALPFVVLMITTQAYRMERILAFLSPSHDPLGAGYQTNAAVEALAGGGVWGRGLGNGVQKLGSVPEVYSDFVFVVWAEEMGLIGVVAYFLLLAGFAAAGWRIALKTKNRFASYVSFGATSAIFLQSLLNTAVVSRLVPATGLTLPFFSFGGSSLMVTLCLCGLIMNASGDMEGGVYHV